MSSHGKAETATLRKNLENQLERLMQQLEDVEDIRYCFKTLLSFCYVSSYLEI